MNIYFADWEKLTLWGEHKLALDVSSLERKLTRISSHKKNIHMLGKTVRAMGARAVIVQLGRDLEMMESFTRSKLNKLKPRLEKMYSDRTNETVDDS